MVSFSFSKRKGNSMTTTEKMLITVGALTGGAIISIIIDIRQQKQIEDLTNMLNKVVLIQQRTNNRYDELFKLEHELEGKVQDILSDLE